MIVNDIQLPSDLNIVLASSSPYRRALMDRLQIAYDTCTPEIDESRLQGESVEDMVKRLSEVKARSVAAAHPRCLIIGSDQVAVFDGQILGKPGGFDNAFSQLRLVSGRKVEFLTGLCVLNTNSDRSQVAMVPFSVYFKHLDDNRITNYLNREQPCDCAGSIKSEGLGITLFEKMAGDDPTALMGLPLITLTGMLETEDIIF